MRRRAGRSSIAFAAVTAAVTLSACGSSGSQAAKEPTGNYPVVISTASFPSSQHLAQHSKLTITVRNAGNKTIPDVAVTICNVTCSWRAPAGQGTSVAAFAQYFNMPGVAWHSRPVWIIDRPPGLCGYSCAQGGQGAAVTSDANTWALGALKPGRTVTFSWGVTAVAPGRHVVAWRVSASLYGKSKAVLPDGSPPRGAFSVDIAHTPAQSYVNDSGQIVNGQ